MKMFHGTVDAFLPSIKKQGLRPNAKHAWRMSWNDGEELRDEEKVDAVYLTPVERRAIEYAETRVRYFAAQPGETFFMFDYHSVPYIKDVGAEVLQVSPVLLVIEIEENDRRLEPDPRDPYTGYRFVGHVPMSAIVEIRPLSPKLPEKSVAEKRRDDFSEFDRLLTQFDAAFL